MSIKFRKPGRDAAWNDWRTLACDCRSNTRHVVVHEFELLLLRRLFVCFIETGRKLTASDYEECPLRGRSCEELPEKSPVNQRYRKKCHEADQQHTATRFHRLVESRGRIN